MNRETGRKIIWSRVFALKYATAHPLLAPFTLSDLTRGKLVADQFLKAYHKVFLSDDYLSLSHVAKNLLVAVALQYNGTNNGDLAITPKLMAKHGLGSPATLNKAKRELLAANLIGLTRQGGLPNKCSLFEITWEKRNHCNGKMDVQPTSLPSRTHWEQKIMNREREAQLKTSAAINVFRKAG